MDEDDDSMSSGERELREVNQIYPARQQVVEPQEQYEEQYEEDFQNSQQEEEEFQNSQQEEEEFQNREEFQNSQQEEVEFQNSQEKEEEFQNSQEKEEELAEEDNQEDDEGINVYKTSEASINDQEYQQIQQYQDKYISDDEAEEMEVNGIPQQEQKAFSKMPIDEAEVAYEMRCQKQLQELQKKLQDGMNKNTLMKVDYTPAQSEKNSEKGDQSARNHVEDNQIKHQQNNNNNNNGRSTMPYKILGQQQELNRNKNSNNNNNINNYNTNNYNNNSNKNNSNKNNNYNHNINNSNNYNINNSNNNIKNNSNNNHNNNNINYNNNNNKNIKNNNNNNILNKHDFSLEQYQNYNNLKSKAQNYHNYNNHINHSHSQHSNSNSKTNNNNNSNNNSNKKQNFSKSSSIQKLQHMYEYGLAAQIQKQERCEFIRKEKEQQILENCTFTPQISQKARLLSPERNNYLDIHTKTEIYMQRKQLLVDKKLEEAEREFQECTFKPNINHSYNALQQDNSKQNIYERQVQWQKKVSEKNEKRLQENMSLMQSPKKHSRPSSQSAQSSLNTSSHKKISPHGFYTHQKVSPTFITFLNNKYQVFQSEMGSARKPETSEMKSNQSQQINNNSEQKKKIKPASSFKDISTQKKIKDHLMSDQQTFQEKVLLNNPKKNDTNFVRLGLNRTLQRTSSPPKQFAGVHPRRDQNEKQNQQLLNAFGRVNNIVVEGNRYVLGEQNQNEDLSQAFQQAKQNMKESVLKMFERNYSSKINLKNIRQVLESEQSNLIYTNNKDIKNSQRD